MAAVPIKAQYGPTLGQLLSPRWRAAPGFLRLLLRGAGCLLVLALVAGGLTLENAHYSHPGRPAFGFSYRGLYRAAPGPGEYVKLQRLAPGGGLEDSFAVQPLRLPPYSGNLSGELALYAVVYIHTLERRYADFQLRADGASKVDLTRAFDIYFTTTREGHLDYGRVVLYMPGKSGAREGVAIVALTSQPPRYPLNAPPEIAAAGVLARPLRSFSFG